VIINAAWCQCQHKNQKSTADSFKANAFGKAFAAAAMFQKISLHPRSQWCRQRDSKRASPDNSNSPVPKKTGGRLCDRREPNPIQKSVGFEAKRIPADLRGDYFAFNTVEKAAGDTESLFSYSVFYCLHCH